MSIYDFKVKKADGSEATLEEYKGKVMLIVNTATECGFTPQYELLQKIYAAHEGEGLAILDFPCNQFGNQAPGTEEEIHTFCTGRFGVTFPMYAKVEVNGENEEPLFAYLKEQKGFAGFAPEHELSKILNDMLGQADPDFASKPDIKWNFTKFLVDREGNVVERFEPTEDMAVVEEKIRALL